MNSTVDFVRRGFATDVRDEHKSGEEAVSRLTKSSSRDRLIDDKDSSSVMGGRRQTRRCFLPLFRLGFCAVWTRVRSEGNFSYQKPDGGLTRTRRPGLQRGTPRTRASKQRREWKSSFEAWS
jgi:hypothetical protein